MTAVRGWRGVLENVFRGAGRRRLRKGRRDFRPEAMESRLLLTAFTVNTTADVVAADGVLSLREAVLAASSNTAAGDAAAGSAAGDVIRFDASLNGATITLTLGELGIADDLVIAGEGRGITISGGGASRIFNIATADFVGIYSLSLVNGNTATVGGAVAVAGGGVTRLDQLRITGNRAGGAGGGGIYNLGSTVVVVDSFVRSNTALGRLGSGGGILNDAGGTLGVYNSLVSNNFANRAGGGIEDASGAGFGTTLQFVALVGNGAGKTLGTGNDPVVTPAPGNGGGLHVTGQSDVTVIGSRVANNLAAKEGGGLWNDKGKTSVFSSVIDGNRASGNLADDGGGGIFNNGGTLVVEASSCSNNLADGTAGSGGGIFSTAGDLLVRNSLLIYNVANRAGGGIEVIAGNATVTWSILTGNLAGPSGSAAPGNGGGLHVTGAAVVGISGTVVNNNAAAKEGGGLWNSATGRMAVRNSSINGNASRGTAAGDGGGGIFNDNGGTLAVADSAIYFNTAARDGAGIFNGTGGRLTVSNTTLFSNRAARFGGGLFSDGDLDLLKSFLVGNAAADGATIFNDMNGDADVDDLFLLINGRDAVDGTGTVS